MKICDDFLLCIYNLKESVFIQGLGSCPLVLGAMDVSAGLIVALVPAWCLDIHRLTPLENPCEIKNTVCPFEDDARSF